MVNKLFFALFADPRNIGRICEMFQAMPNIKFPTMGGEVFWTTEASSNGFKVQRNVFTGHYRLLDPDNWRLAWGSESYMKKLFESMI